MEEVSEKAAKFSPSRDALYTASDVAVGLGFASIAASIVTWFLNKPKDPAHSERFGIFIGLWVPSFFILANYLAHRADSK